MDEDIKALGFGIVIGMIFGVFVLTPLIVEFGPGISFDSGVEAMGGMKTMGHAVRPAANLSHEVVGRMSK